MSEASPSRAAEGRPRRAGRIAWLALLVVAAAGGAAAYKFRHTETLNDLPSAPARQGDFSVVVRCRGELKARRSVQVTAPVNVPDLRIVWLAPPGSAVKAGDIVIKFDPSAARQQLQEKEAALRQAQATLDQATAQARITEEQDKLDFAKSQYDLERQKLEASKQEIVSALQAEETKIDLGIAEKDLIVKEAAMKLHAASGRAKTASATRLRDHAQADVELTQERLKRMEIAAPLSGVIVYLPNYSQGWVNTKPFQVGDSAWPGAAVAEVPDLSTIEMEGKIDEIDRGKVKLGDPARVIVDALPELNIQAKLTLLSPLTEQTFEFPPSSSFRGYARIEHPDPRLRPGMNGRVDVEIDRIPKAISIPAKALFTRDGKPVVFEVQKGVTRPVEVQVLARNPDEIAVKGIPAGTMVALVDPEKKDQKK